MNPENVAERKKLKYRFAILYIVSIILLAVIFTALWNTSSSSRQVASGDKPGGTSEEYEILKHDDLLHAGLKNLQQLDEKYTVLISDSAGKQALDSLNELIDNAETSFSNTIANIESKKKTFNVSSNAVKLDSIISAFRSALNNRKSLSYIRAALSGENLNFNIDNMKLLELEMELQKKDNRILALEDQLRLQKQSTSDNSSNASEVQLKNEIQVLQAGLRKEEEKISSLLALNNSLTKDNNRLTAQFNDLKSNTSSLPKGQEGPESSKNNNLQSKIDDLDAELKFAKIDCNLSRADAKQIISNFRQRKDLLQESLNTLNTLSHSNNITIQKKAKEKLNQLQAIALTVRD